MENAHENITPKQENNIYICVLMFVCDLYNVIVLPSDFSSDCLDILITSLDQSPLNSQHVPVLFFLAETMLYWLRTEAVQQVYLRTGEVKLLKVFISYGYRKNVIDLIYM